MIKEEGLGYAPGNNQSLSFVIGLLKNEIELAVTQKDHS